MPTASSTWRCRQAQFAIPGGRYDVRLTSVRGAQTAGERLALYRG